MLLSLLVACTTPSDTQSEVQAPTDDLSLACNTNEGEHDLQLFQADGALVVQWESEEVWSFAVTTPDAKIGRYGRLESGRLHWAVAGEDFSELLVSPVFYGTVPAEAQDYTAYMGGDRGALDTERCYELQTSDLHHGHFGKVQFRLNTLPVWPG